MSLINCAEAELRVEALRLASALDYGESAEEIVHRSQVYFDFLNGKAAPKRARRPARKG